MSEETGISQNQLNLIEYGDHTLPFDIDSHHIPANPKKAELGHFHHDFRFLFQYKGEQGITINADESLGYKWVALEGLVEDEIFGGMVEKIRKVT